MKIVSNVPHPAKYSEDIAEHFAQILAGEWETHVAHELDDRFTLTVLDPFGGIGGIHQIATYAHEMFPGNPRINSLAIELEAEWAAESATYGPTICADFLRWGRDVRLDGTIGPLHSKQFNVCATSCTYANRMADHHTPRERSKRNTYRHTLGRELTENNSGGWGWTGREGEKYRAFHRESWQLVYDLLRPGGLFLLNVKDHYRTLRKGEPAVKMPVTVWHLTTAKHIGFKRVGSAWIKTKGNRQGKNGTVRADGEMVFHLRKPFN